jgi:hypothetical protein
MTVRWSGHGTGGTLTIPEISHDMTESDYVFDGALDSGGKPEIESRAKKSLGPAMCKIFQAFPKVSSSDQPKSRLFSLTEMNIFFFFFFA